MDFFIIPHIKIVKGTDFVGIPILNTDIYCWIEWKEEESWDDVMKNQCEYSSLNDSCFESKSGINFICSYLILCKKTGVKYLLVSKWEINDFSDLEDCFCIPPNYFNLCQIYSKFKNVVKEDHEDVFEFIKTKKK